MNVFTKALAAACAVVVVCVSGRGRVPAAAQSALPTGFADDVVLRGLNQPTAVRFSPDGRIFVAEKSGIIKVFDNLSDSTPTVFADLRTNVHNYWDRGLLGLALDPSFPARPYVYVLYTFDGPIGGTAPTWGTAGVTSDGCPDPPGSTAEGCVVSGRVSRLEAAGNVMTGVERVLVHDWFQQFPGHSIGSLTFGPDGALYASGGEGASFQFVDYGQIGNPGGDPPVAAGVDQAPPAAEGGALRSQDLRTMADRVGLNGAIIRIDPGTGAALPDNPLYGQSDANAKRIVAYGFRNPFRMAFRPGATRELWVGDVGWRTWEEIDVIPDTRAAPVRNFGWPCYEGNARQSGYDAVNLNLCEGLYAQTGAVTAPHYAYRDSTAVVTGETCSNANSSITGVAFYTGSLYPAQYQRALFFADYSRRCIWVMYADGNGRPDAARRATFVQGAAYPVDLQSGPNGDLFYVDFTGGSVHRVRYGRGPFAGIEASPLSGATPLTVRFDGTGSSDPDGAPLSYTWDLNGDGTFGDATTATPTYTYATAGNYDVRLRVTDGEGLSAAASIVIQAGNTPPVPTIDTPVPAPRWAVGQTINFSGRATDREQGAIPASALSWSLIMNHCATQTGCHQHPIQDFAGVAGGSFVAPDHEYPSYLELRLRATDSGGLQATTTIRLDPQSVDIGFRTNPTGLQVGIGSESVTATSRTFIVGSRASISAPAPQMLAGVTYVFTSWSDGGAQTHTIVAGLGGTTFTANFARAGAGLDPADRVIHAARATARVGNWQVVRDSTAAGLARMEQPNAGAAKVPTPLSSPANYFEARFHAEAARAYRIWIRGRAAGDSVQQRLRVCAVLEQPRCSRFGRIPHRHELRDRTRGRGVSRLRFVEVGMGGQRLRRIRPAALFRIGGHSDHSRAGTRGWRLYRSNRHLAGDLSQHPSRTRTE